MLIYCCLTFLYGLTYVAHVTADRCGVLVLAGPDDPHTEDRARPRTLGDARTADQQLHARQG